MQILIATLLMANIVVIVATGTTIGKEINRINRKLETYDANSYRDRTVIECKINDLEHKIDVNKLGKELKDHIAKEFMAMTFRGIKISGGIRDEKGNNNF